MCIKISYPTKREDGLSGAVEKVLFNHKAHKVGTKGTKLKLYNIDLCDLCEKPLCPFVVNGFRLFIQPLVRAYSKMETRFHVSVEDCIDYKYYYFWLTDFKYKQH